METSSSFLGRLLRDFGLQRGYQIEIQIVNHMTYFSNLEMNLIMNCKIHYQ